MIVVGLKEVETKMLKKELMLGAAFTGSSSPFNGGEKVTEIPSGMSAPFADDGTMYCSTYIFLF